jgi:uncharacterized membrane protein
MKFKWMTVAALSLALATLAGCCQSNQKTQYLPPQTAGSRNGVVLFGPTPLALGCEDRGYFAPVLVAGEAPLLLLSDQRRSYVRTEIWDNENNFAPFSSQYQMWRHSVDEGPAQR